MENGRFEDVFPTKMGIFHGYVRLPEGRFQLYVIKCKHQHNTKIIAEFFSGTQFFVGQQHFGPLLWEDPLWKEYEFYRSQFCVCFLS